ncbi:MAG TPA: tRNA (adenine-N1)-methyltransferase [Thermoplasmata archaeon]|nr:tRNA (adenine-N1)-methyltransferase [Thermoplasmata archaeon]
MSGDTPLRSGELVLLRRSDRDALLLRITDGPQVVEGLGVVDLSPFIGRPAGSEVTWAGARFRILRPNLVDRVRQLHRKAQIVTPKDAQYLLFLTGIGPGSRVAEAGAGSGALTLVLAHAVGEAGRVYSFDRRPDFLEVARRNVEAMGFGDRVEFRERDIAQSGIDLADLDAVVLDLAEPWTILESARAALAAGGCVGTYTPTYNQLERTVVGLRSLGFEEIRSVELLEREMHVGSGGTRPEFEMLGHTGFLTTGRKV